jgi:hypothetical protein
MAAKGSRAPGGNGDAAVVLETAARSYGHNSATTRARSKLAPKPTQTAVVWTWRPGPLDVRIDADPQPDDCPCLLFAGHAPLSAFITEIEDCIALALGPGRLAFVEVIAPERPEWLP